MSDVEGDTDGVWMLSYGEDEWYGVAGPFSSPEKARAYAEAIHPNLFDATRDPLRWREEQGPSGPVLQGSIGREKYGRKIDEYTISRWPYDPDPRERLSTR